MTLTDLCPGPPGSDPPEYEVHEGESAGRTKIIGVVKADGYGCGAGETARAADPYAAAFAAATADEALSLRREGILNRFWFLEACQKRDFMSFWRLISAR